MSVSPRHVWVAGATSAARSHAVAGLAAPAALTTVDAHRRLRGPYTAGGSIVRALVPAAMQRAPDLVKAHEVEILSVAPELRDLVPASRETLTSLAVPEERTRFYSRLRTLRHANGLTEFVRDWARGYVGGPVSIVVHNAHEADPTDVELLSVLARRLDPALVRMVICTAFEPPEAPLAAALERYAQRVAADEDPLAATPADPGDVAALAAAYVATDCTSDRPDLREAYLALPPEERARRHDERAAELEESGEWSFRLGAVPYHRELGADPEGRGAAALRVTLDYCIDMGFYAATIDAGWRGQRLSSPEKDIDQWWMFTTKTTTALAVSGRAEEAEALYDSVRARITNPKGHMQAAYATAMLYTRHHAPERRNEQRARGWINASIAIAELLPKPDERAFHTVFNHNGLALIEMHAGNLQEALRLVTMGLDKLDRELPFDKHRLHRSVLRHNRAQVLAALGRLPEALDDYTAVIADDPNYPEYYFDRAAVLRRLGRFSEALADYATADTLGPPFPEVYYNRADLYAARGDTFAALADYSYVLEIDPTYLDALVNRAGILIDLGDTDGARRDVDAGLEAAPDNAYLWCLRGRLELDAGGLDAARAALDEAIRLDRRLVEAWATRAAVSYEQGRLESALADLDHASTLAEDPAVLFNRGDVYQAMQRWSEAVADFDRVVELTPEDPQAWLRRAVCLLRLGDRGGARSDLEEFLRLAPDGHAEAAALAPELMPALREGAR